MPRERSEKRSSVRTSITRASLRSSRERSSDEHADAMKKALREAKAAGADLMKYGVARKSDATFEGAVHNEMSAEHARRAAEKALKDALKKK